MWEMATLFENVGTVQDGIATLARTRTVVDRPDAAPLVVTRGELRFDGVDFGYGGRRQVLHDFRPDGAPGEKIGLVGRSAPASPRS